MAEQPRTKAAAATALSPKQAKQNARATKKAERARRKASTDPADMGRLRQIRRAYELTHEYDRQLPYVLLAAALVPLVVGVVVGVLTDHPIYLGVMGLLLGVLLAMLLLVRRAKAATYRRYAGQAGSAEVALQMLPKQWVSSPVIAANKSRDVVHRTVGPGGLVLIGEGEPGRVRQLLASEVRKHERVAYGVTVHQIVMGDKEGQVPLGKLADHIRAAQDAAAAPGHRRAGAAAGPRRGPATGATAQGPDADQRSPGEGLTSGDARPLTWPRGPPITEQGSEPDPRGEPEPCQQVGARDEQPGQRRARQHQLRHPDPAGRRQPGSGPW